MLIDSLIGVEHPIDLAKQIARLLESDPIASRQVREHITNDRLVELLEIVPPATDTLDEALGNCRLSDHDIERLMRERYKPEMSDVDEHSLIKEVLRRWPTKAKVLEALW